MVARGELSATANPKGPTTAFFNNLGGADNNWRWFTVSQNNPLPVALTDFVSHLDPG